MRSTLMLLSLAVVLTPRTRSAADEPPARGEIVSHHKIWDRDPHSAFTDLIHHKGSWFCVFRVGKGHVSPDGSIQVLSSTDGRQWAPISRLNSDTADLRDPKISVTPDGKLMLLAAGALHPPAKVKHQTMVWFSDDGKTWTDPVPVGDPNVWLWRVTWHRGTAYGVGYSTADEKFIRLYRSKDGKKFETLVDKLSPEGYPNETSLLFDDKDVCHCLLRRDGGQTSAQYGFAQPPYEEWTWKDLGTRVGGPCHIRLADGRVYAVVRLYAPKVRTAVCRIDPDAGKVDEVLPLPSGGDTSYAGMVWHDGLLWVSYYASHEGKTSIYLARVKLPPK
jgi:hypothetical protein